MMAEVVSLGADGGVNGGANLFPKLYVELYDAAVAKDLEKVEELHAKVMQICSSLYNVGCHGSSYLKGVKCGLSVLGICSDYVAMPFKKFDKDYRKKIEDAIKTIDL
jgi:4-hydroxy-tetrahydrodipicolinate synthase